MTFERWFKVTAHPSPINTPHEKHEQEWANEYTVWTVIFKEICYNLDLWPRNFIQGEVWVRLGKVNRKYALDIQVISDWQMDWSLWVPTKRTSIKKRVFFSFFNSATIFMFKYVWISQLFWRLLAKRWTLWVPYKKYTTMY